MNIAFIGAGNVGTPLADHLQRLGHRVLISGGSPSSPSLKSALERNPKLEATTIPDAIRGAEVIFLATPFQALSQVIPPISESLSGKILVDCTNPVGPGLTHGLKSEQSGSAYLQKLAPGARVVKAFTIYGFENFEDSSFPAYSQKPAMFFCGADAEAKKAVGTLISQLGWEPLDVGGLEQALHLEHMTLLWVRMVRVHGASPHMVWGVMRRP